MGEGELSVAVCWTIASTTTSEHLMWGLGFYVSLILGAIPLFAWRR